MAPYQSKWDESEAVYVSSTKFAEQKVLIGYKDVGGFRGISVPRDWGKMFYHRDKILF